MEDGNDISDLLHGTVVDREQQISAAKPDRRSRRAWCDLGRDNAFGLLPPEHAVFDFVPGRACRDIRRT